MTETASDGSIGMIALASRSEAVLDHTVVTARARRRRAHFIGRALRLTDCAALVAAFAIVEVVLASAGRGDRLGTAEEVALLGLALPTWLVLAKARGLYDRDRTRADYSTPDEIAALAQLITFGSWIVLVAAYLIGLHLYLPRAILFWLLALVLLVAGRAITRTAARRARPYIQRTVIVGAGEVGQLVARKVLDQPHSGIELVGFVDAEPRERPAELEQVPVLGPPARIRDLVDHYEVDRVVVAFSRDVDEQTLALVRDIRDREIQIDIVPRLFDSLGPRATLHTIAGFPLVNLPEASLSSSALFVKRVFDFMGSLLLLVLLAPMFALVALLIKLDSPGPVFYRQERLGLHGRPFKILKFRTMRIDADEHLARLIATDPELRREYEANHKLARDPRVTRVGSVLRRTSIDELPQILNVLWGEMSLVGPRPIVEAERRRYRDDASRLIDLPPGMTGYWQISGRSNVSYAERVRLDMAYVRNWSLGLDLLILAKTVRALLSGQGAY